MTSTRGLGGTSDVVGRSHDALGIVEPFSTAAGSVSHPLVRRPIGANAGGDHLQADIRVAN